MQQTTIIPLTTDELCGISGRKSQAQGRAPLTPERRDRIANWAKTLPRNQLEMQIQMSEMHDNPERAAVFETELASRHRPVAERVVKAARSTSMCSAWRPIAQRIATRHGLTIDEMMSGRRHKRCRRARWEFWHHLHTERGISLSQIAARTGGYHHTSVMHAVREFGRQSA